VTSVTVTGTKADATASLSGPVTLSNLVVAVAQTATITVTAQDGTTKPYTVAVTRVGTSTKAISSFSFASPAATGVIDDSSHTVTIHVPHGTNVGSLTPTISDTGASISPASGVAQNFTNPVSYRVTAQDTTYQDYMVTVIVDAAQASLTVNNDGNGTTNPSGTSTVNCGAPISISATPTPGGGCSFSQWTETDGSGHATFFNSSLASTTVTLTGNATIQANFLDPYTYIYSTGWESDAGWTYHGSTTQDSSNAHSGSYELKILSDNTSNCTYDCHDASIPTSNEYKYSFWVKGADPSSSVGIGVAFFDSSSTQMSSLSQTYNVSNTYTQLVRGDLPIPSGTAWVQVMFWSNGSGTSYIYVDDFNFGVK
jgi:hypothetical protein